jgi:hypothetical protein
MAANIPDAKFTPVPGKIPSYETYYRNSHNDTVISQIITYLKATAPVTLAFSDPFTKSSGESGPPPNK